MTNVRGKGKSNLVSTEEELTKLKTDIQAYINEGYSKSKAISKVAEDRDCSDQLIWKRLRE